MTVADSGPLIAFARIGRLDLLHQVLEEILIPEAVYQEVVVRGRGRPGASDVAESSWIRRRTVSDRAALESFPRRLHPGEREAIVLAQELGDALLIDEIRGRAAALERGIEVMGTLAVLAEARRLGFIEQVTPVLESMLSSGYWIDAELVATFLKDIGEPSDE